jgi:thiamine biosynthesis lipoprotein
MIGAFHQKMSALMISVADRNHFHTSKAASVLGAALLFVQFTALISCASNARRTEQLHVGQTQGTTYMVKYLAEDPIPQSEIDSVLHDVDVALNLWWPSSVISKVNAWSRTDTVFDFVDTAMVWSVVFDRSRELYRESGGAFDPTVQPLVELWGFGLSNRTAVTQEAVDSVMMHVGFDWSRIDMNEIYESRQYVRTEMLKRDPGCGLDFNSIAQGYTVDLMSDLLMRHNIQDFMVEIGGEVKCHGVNAEGNSWRIAIDKPVTDWTEGRQLEAIVELDNAALCTSGSYRKFYMDGDIRRSHTIDPRTGYPVEHGLLSVTIRAADASTADGLATACMVLGESEGRDFVLTYRNNHPEEAIEAFFIYSGPSGNPEHWLSPGWSNTISFLGSEAS